MPLVPIYLSAEHIIGLHETLIQVYREEDPPTKIEPGFNYKGAIENICFIVATDKYREEGFSHFLERVAYLFYHLNRSHPFTDGNKRTALLATYYFMIWNGYFLNIPDDAHKLILAIADSKRQDVTMEHAYNWILENVARDLYSTIFMRLMHLIVVASVFLLRAITHESVHDVFAYLLYNLKVAELMNALVDKAGLKKVRYRK